MSRIGRNPIAIPAGVSVAMIERRVEVKGPKGSLERALPGDITVRQEGSTLVVERPNEERHSKALHGLTRTLVANMVAGVSEGFAKELEKGQDDLPRGDFASGEPGLEFGQGEMLEHDAGSDYSTIFGTTNNPLARAGALRRASS